jgi:hypothetical protein
MGAGGESQRREPRKDARTLRKLLALLLFAVTLQVCLGRTPSTFIVAKTGNDTTGNGSLSTPWLTINKCKDSVQPGDTCYIRTGTYNGGIELGANIGYGGSTSGTSWGNPNTLAAFPGEEGTVILTNDGYDQILDFSGGVYGTSHYEQYWIIRDLIFDGSTGTGDHCEVQRTCTGLINGGGDHIKFINIVLRHSPENGIIFDGDYWEFLNVDISGIGDVLAPTDTSHGIYWHGNNSTLIGGRIHDNTGYGIQMYNGGNLVSHNVVTGVRLDHNYTGHLFTHQHGGGGIVMGSGSDNHVIESIIDHNYGNAVDFDYRCGLYSDGSIPDFANPCGARNNTLAFNEQSAVSLGYNNGTSPADCVAFFGQPCLKAVLENNIFYGNGIDDYSMNAGAATVVENNDLKGVNPSFVDASGGDFRIPLMSAAAGYGVNRTSLCSGILLYLCTTFANQPRPAMGSWDAGAHNAGDVAGTPATISAISPTSAAQGDVVAINVVGATTNFVNSTTVCTMSGTGITINSTTVSDSTHGVCNVTLSGGATLGLRSLTMTTTSEVATGTNAFTVNSPIVISGIIPVRGTQGSTVAIEVTGVGTHFSNGTSVCSLSGSNITVSSTAVADATHLTCNISISGSAIASDRTLTVTTTAEVVSAVNAFTVTPSTNAGSIPLRRH